VSIPRQTVLDAHTNYWGCREQVFSPSIYPCKEAETIISIVAQNFSSYIWKVKKEKYCVCACTAQACKTPASWDQHGPLTSSASRCALLYIAYV